MTDLNKFSIEAWEQWFTLKISEKTDITDKELADVLSEQDISRIQELKLAKKREQYKKLQPAGFEHAPESAKQKRQELSNSDNVEKLQWIYDNVSYNSDHTMNIITLKKIFCEDISWNKQTMNFNDAKKLATSKWYKLMTDYNDTDAEEIKKQSDWYKVINLFSWNKWDTVEWMTMFRDMSWCNDRYWTTTPYKNEKWEDVSGVVRDRLLNKGHCHRRWNNTNYNNRVCGFKDSM